ncbi:MAG: hypothetical protein CM15mP117_01330 [Alphaproteobacteria bacterium]|nr:MAG: hypothetical protein CM15mP117_01330 [Alphaproteobacteria bacterium]
MNKIARDISLLSTKNEEMLDTKNARSAESEEYLNKKAIIIQVIINKNPDIGDSIAMIPNPVATTFATRKFQPNRIAMSNHSTCLLLFLNKYQVNITQLYIHQMRLFLHLE